MKGHLVPTFPDSECRPKGRMSQKAIKKKSERIQCSDEDRPLKATLVGTIPKRVSKGKKEAR